MSNKRKNIVFGIELAINFVSVTAVLFAIVSIIGMIENMEISTESLKLFLPCVAWLTTVGIYTHLVNK